MISTNPGPLDAISCFTGVDVHDLKDGTVIVQTWRNGLKFERYEGPSRFVTDLMMDTMRANLLAPMPAVVPALRLVTG